MRTVQKSPSMEQELQKIAAGDYSLTGNGALQTLWRASKSVPNPSVPLGALADCLAVDSAMRYALERLDITRPLAVDVGCGFAGFSLALARVCDDHLLSGIDQSNAAGDEVAQLLGRNDPVRNQDSGALHDFNSRVPPSLVGVNVLGIELQAPAVRRSRAIAARCNLDDRCVHCVHFFAVTAKRNLDDRCVYCVHLF